MKNSCLLCVVALGLTVGILGCSAPEEVIADRGLTDEEIDNLVQRSYQYVAMYHVYNKFALKQGGWNTVDADTELKDHTMREIARPNNDTLYIGTTAGLLYKANIGAPQELEDRTGLGEGFKVTSALWTPFPILSTGGNPISQSATVIFVPELGHYALAVGTGDREDLWFDTFQEGRFYMFLDRGFQLGDATLPVVEADLRLIDDTDTNVTGDFLRQAPFGWFITLEVEERVISRAFSLSGVTVFSSFQPLEDVSEDGSVCQRFGNSRTFVVNTTNANSLLGSGDKFFVIEGGFLSPAFAETSQTKNPDDPDAPPPPPIPDNLQNVIDEIKKLLPTDCRFANYTINIKAVRDDTGIQFLAAIPVCTVETNWKDF